MRHVTNQIQDLLEALENLRNEQRAILIHNGAKDTNNLQNLPTNDLKEYQRLQRERNAKGEFLAKLSGTKDDLKILLGQLSRLSTVREQLLKEYRVKHPFDLPMAGLLAFSQYWEKSEKVGKMIDWECSSNCVKLNF